jgi:hypothetical protein
MFEAIILLVLLGLILWFILAKEQTYSTRKASFIDLSVELKPAVKKSIKGRFS